MIKPIALAVLCIAATLSGPTPGQSKDPFSQTTASSIRRGHSKDGAPVVITTNRRFDYFEIFPDPVHGDSQTYPLVLREEFRSEWQPGMEGKRSTVRVDAWTLDSARRGRKVWSLSSEGDTGERFDDYYVVTRFGCCASLTTRIWFNLVTGKKVFTATQDLARIIVPNTSPGLARYVAYHHSEGAMTPDESKTRKDVIGVIQYGTDRSVLKRLIVHAPFDPGQPVISLRSDEILQSETRAGRSELILWKANGRNDKSSLSGFSILMSWGEGREIWIPVNNDTLETGNARVSGEFSLEATN